MNKEKGTNPAALAALANNNLENFIVASTEGGIEAQEAAGQAKFVESQSLPKKCPRAELECLGFVFKEDVDDIFVSVQFPVGWSLNPTEHSMWNDLLDEQGRKRGSVFYKAAFYDRSAHMHLERRYTHRRNYELEKGQIQYQVFDCATPVFETDIKSTKEYSDEYWDIDEDLQKISIAYLSENYPKHEDCTAYWA